jgi:hypothetical protein
MTPDVFILHIVERFLQIPTVINTYLHSNIFGVPRHSLGPTEIFFSFLSEDKFRLFSTTFYDINKS